MFAKWSAGSVSGVRWTTDGPAGNSDAKTVIISQAVKTPRRSSRPPRDGIAGQLRADLHLRPGGLRPGSSGFCTVAMTGGMPSMLIDRLESLSSYQPIYPPGSQDAAKNPIVYAHWRVPAAGRVRSVLSRIEQAGLDYTQRPNKLAYHVVVDPARQPLGGPAWTMTQPGVMLQNWSGEPALIQRPQLLPLNDIRPAPCQAWRSRHRRCRLGGRAGRGVFARPVQGFIRDLRAGLRTACAFGRSNGIASGAVALVLHIHHVFYGVARRLDVRLALRCRRQPGRERAQCHATSGILLDLTTHLGLPDKPAAEKSRGKGRS